MTLVLAAASAAREESSVTSDVIAWATLVAVLATGLATVILAWKTSNMATSTEKMAKASIDGIGLQREELEAVKEQLKLAREEFETSRRAAQPELEVGVLIPQPSVVTVQVVYITGSEPAYEVTVWVRTSEQYAALNIATVIAGSPPRNLRYPSSFSQLNDDDIANVWPFTVARAPLQADSHIWAGITWQAADRTEGRHLRLLNGAAVLSDLRGAEAR